MFDPFGDFEAAGYLRNRLGLKDPVEIDNGEHSHFQAGLPDAVRHLRRRRRIEYRDFCEVHRILFGGFYPWAGQDRLTLGVGEIISRGGKVQFARSDDSQRAIEEGLRVGNDPADIATRSGYVMSYFAFGHAFLDGNGRTMTVVHAELLHRAGYVIDWRGTRKNEYLDVLTRDIDNPRANLLDAYFRPRLLAASERVSWVDQLRVLPGLDGRDSDPAQTVAYRADDPRGKAEYEEMVRRRGQ